MFCSIFILIMGVAAPKMLSNEQKKAMNAQRAHETYGFLKDPRANPYAEKEEWSFTDTKQRIMA